MGTVNDVNFGNGEMEASCHRVVLKHLNRQKDGNDEDVWNDIFRNDET